MHESKENARHHDTWDNAKPLCKHWKEITAKNRFLDERCDEHGHAHKRKGHIAVLEKVLNWRVFRGFHRDRDDHDDKRQTAPQKKIEPRPGRRFPVLAIEFSPAKRLPERRSIKKCQRDVKKTEQQCIP